MIMNITVALVCVIIFAYGLISLMFAIRDKIYQKEWYKEKAMRIRQNPKISRAELCEYFVMFCLRNSCKVEY